MGQRKVEASEWVCDSCESVTTCPQGQVPPKWFTGEVATQQIQAQEWAACQRSHIKGSVLNVLFEAGMDADEEGRGGPGGLDGERSSVVDTTATD